MFRFLITLFVLVCSPMALAQQGQSLAELEALLEEAKSLGIDDAQTRMLEDMVKQLKQDEAENNNVAGPGAIEAPANSRQDETLAASQPDERKSTDTTTGDVLTYTASGGERKTVSVDKSERGAFAGVYANEHHDKAVADFRYTLNADGTATLKHRVCENCTHELDGQASSRDWQVEYEALEWAPMLADDGAPMMRRVKDMAGASHQARVLIVTLAGGKVMSLSHYTDGQGPALAGPYGVPRYRQ